MTTTSLQRRTLLTVIFIVVNGHHGYNLCETLWLPLQLQCKDPAPSMML